MSYFVTVIVFLLIFSVVVLIHEWGHFFMARRNGVKVEEFSMGLPPVAKRFYKDKKGTDYCLGWIPFGGYVRMYGEDSHDPKALRAKDSFAHQTKWARTQIILAGVVMNFVLAFVIFTALFAIGTKPILLPSNFDEYREAGYVEAVDAVIVQSAVEGSGAADAGLVFGDIIESVDGKSVSFGEELIGYLSTRGGSSVVLTLEREKEQLDVTVRLSEDGKMGAVIGDVPVFDYDDVKEFDPMPIHIAAYEGASQTVELTAETVKMFGVVVKSIFTKGDVPAGVVGPVGIAALTHEVLKRGVDDLLKFIALISVSLGAINALPIPALDGGRFLFIVIEALRGKAADALWEARVHGIGFLLLIGLILFVTYKDILGLF
jgi:regulator of sigma E protease